MGLLDRLLGRVACVKCGVFVPVAVARATPVKLEFFDIITELRGGDARRRQIEGDSQARLTGVGLLCEDCYGIAYEAMPEVQIMHENRKTQASAETRHWCQLMDAGVPVSEVLAAGGTIEFEFANHFDAAGRLIID
jgi:hypothetical protein